MDIILTGDRPTGKLHLGHYVGSLKQRVKLQNEGNFDKMYVMIADAQGLTDNFDNPKKIKDNIIEVALDYLSVGINEIKQKEYEKSIPVGFFCYPISQAADITLFKANIVPVGDDQLPMIEQTNEIVNSFNRIYGDTLVNAKAILPNNEQAKRLPGLDGKAKMSKSLGNCIYLSDTSDEVYKKVMSMYTDPNHIKVEDKGSVKGNMVFTYLDVFSNDELIRKYSKYNSLEEMKKHYKKGGLGDVVIKKVLYNILEEILEPIREKRKYYEDNIDKVYDILKDGTRKAREEANKTIKEVRKALMIDYFS